jgi:3-oxoacyl-[acyl-carrier-protein] synthase II
MVLSTLSGEIAQACRIKGANLTLVDGRTAGLRGLLAACEYLRQSDELDALVIVAADEIGSLFFRLFERLGMVADTETYGGLPRPYDPQAGGVILGEGSVALVLERKTSAQDRNARAYARIAGHGMTADALPDCGLEPQGRWLEQAARLALAEANLDVEAIDAVYGHGCGEPRYDGRELQALGRLLEGRAVPLGCVVGHLGLAEASCGLFSVAAALLGMRNGEVYPIATGGALPDAPAFVSDGIRAGQYRRTLVLGSTEHGNNASVVLSRIDPESR